MFYDCYFTLMSDLMQKFPLAKTNLDNKVTLTLLLAISLLWLQTSLKFLSPNTLGRVLN